MALTDSDFAVLGELIASTTKRMVDTALSDLVAGIATYGTASSTPITDPDGSGKQVVDVSVNGNPFPGVVIRSGETIANGDTVLVLQLGYKHKAGWLVLKV